MTHAASPETLAKVEVLDDLEEVVHELMVTHEAKRVLWFPSELLAPAPDTDPDRGQRGFRVPCLVVSPGPGAGTSRTTSTTTPRSSPPSSGGGGWTR